MVLNARRQELIKLLETSAYNVSLTIDQISGILGVSRRTVRYDLDSIGDELRKKGLILCKKANKGIWVEPVDAGQSTVKASRLPEYREYVLSKKERCHAIIVNMLNCQAELSLEQLADKLIVSRSTLMADLEAVREYLEKHNLSLCSKRGLGLWIQGEEEDVRKVLIGIFAACMHDFDGSQYISEDACPYEAILFREYAQDVPVKEIARYVIEVIEENHLPYNDFSINYMVLSLTVQLKRLTLGKQITKLSGHMFDDYGSAFLNRLSSKIATHFSQYHEYFRNSLEVAFITFQLLCSKISFFSQLEERQKETATQLAFHLAETFVKSCQTWLGDVYSDDEELMYGLALHLQPAIQRARYGIQLTNPMLPQIRDRYHELFIIAVNAVKEIEERLGTRLSEDEIGYLTIHLGGAIERKKIRSLRKLKVLLICGNGIGTAKLLSITLKNRMPYLDIARVVSVYEWKQQDLAHFDLVISTVPLKLKDKAILHVSPILSETEIAVIENQIQYFYNKKFTPVESSGAKKGMLDLKDVLLPEVIELDVRVNSWEDAIRAAGKLLVNIDAVDEAYVDSMVTCVNDMGPYIVIGPGIAMPHSRPEDGVKKICLSMVRLAKPVPFGSLKNDPVDLVVAFGAVDSDSHFQVLSELWQIFSEPSAMRRLRDSRDKQEVLALIAQYSVHVDE